MATPRATTTAAAAYHPLVLKVVSTRGAHSTLKTCGAVAKAISPAISAVVTPDFLS